YDAVLVARQALVLADPTPAARPGGLAGDIIVAIEGDQGTADAQDVGRGGRVGDGPAVAGGRHEGDWGVAAGGREVAVITRIARTLRATKAHRHNRDARL